MSLFTDIMDLPTASLRREVAMIARRAPEAVSAGILAAAVFLVMATIGLLALPYWLATRMHHVLSPRRRR